MTADWQRLAGYVRDRRADLGLTQEEVAAAGGPSISTQRLIEGARQFAYRPAILRKLERALGWERGSARAILGGGEPSPADDDPTLPGIPAAGSGPDPGAVRRGEQIAAELQAIAAGIAGEITAARRHAIPEADIFTDPFERNLWLTELTPEDQRVRAIAALRSARPRRTNNPHHEEPPVELAGLAAWGAAQQGDAGLATRSAATRRRRAVPDPGSSSVVCTHRETQSSGRGGTRCRLSGMRDTTTTTAGRLSGGCGSGCRRWRRSGRGRPRRSSGCGPGWPRRTRCCGPGSRKSWRCWPRSRRRPTRPGLRRGGPGTTSGRPRRTRRCRGSGGTCGCCPGSRSRHAWPGAGCCGRR